MSYELKKIENVKEDLFEQPLQIHVTRDYSLFSFLQKNRDKKHAHKLTKALIEANKLYCNPIIVNKNLEIIDGQGRFEAAKELNLPIYYIIDENAKDDDIIRYNTTVTPWAGKDYVHFHAASGNCDYIFLEKMAKMHDMPVNLIAKAISHRVTVKGKGSSLRTGDLMLNGTYEEIDNILSNADKLRSTYYKLFPDQSSKKKTNMLALWIYVCKEGIMDIERLITRMERYPQHLIVLQSMNRVIPMYELLAKNIYNRNNPTDKVYV